MVLAVLPIGATAQRLAKNQVASYDLGAEPETLDPAMSTGIPEAIVELSCFEGLTRLDEKDTPRPAIAESWTISPDGTLYTFKLRKTKWSDGTLLTAHDFEWAWKRALAPETASEYAIQLWYLKNGQAYNEGTIKDASLVGVKATDDYTLVVRLEHPTAYFLSLCAFPTLMPVNRKVVEANPTGWFQNPATYIGNGPFKVAKWEHNSVLELVKNPNYWDAANVKLEKVIMYLIDDRNTVLSMFETDQIDMAEDPPTTEMPRLEREGLLKFSPYIGTYYYMFNVNKPPVNDPRVRKALTMAIDRAAIIKYVTRAYQTPAFAYTPYGLPDAAPGSDFRKVGGNYFKEDLEAAKKLLAEAGYPGGKGFPTLSILYNTHEGHRRIAEAIQEMWKKNLGINVVLTNQEWKVYLASRDAGDFQVARAGWIGDYLDAMTFMDMWITDGGNNDTGWGDKRYDDLIDRAKRTADPATRMKMLHEAEAILMDAMPIMPIYFYTNPYMCKDWLVGVGRSVLGFVDFSKAYVLER
jgi:oligopeptide transport system substrate-binding protein